MEAWAGDVVGDAVFLDYHAAVDHTLDDARLDVAVARDAAHAGHDVMLLNQAHRVAPVPAWYCTLPGAKSTFNVEETEKPLLAKPMVANKSNSKDKNNFS